MEGIDSRKVGSWTVSCLNDGFYTFEDEDFPTISSQTRAERLTAAGLTGPDTEFAAYLLQADGHAPVLVDAGCGAVFGDLGGRLPERLRALGVAPDMIGRVILTHMHGDHCGGLLAAGERAFVNARLTIHPAEVAARADRDGPAKSVLAAYAGQIDLSQGGDRPISGVTLRNLPGHTVGQMGLVFDDGLFLIADCVHSEALQFPDPQLRTDNDEDHDTAAQTRTELWAELARTGMIWSGHHMLGPKKFARLVRSGQGYKRMPL